jgi:hypothetical protein
MDHVFGPNDDVAIPLMRGFGLLHAQKVTFGMLGYGIGFDLQLVIEQEKLTIPLKYLFDRLCEISKHCGFDEEELKTMPG